MITSSRISLAPYLAIMYHPAEGPPTGHRGSIHLLLFNKRYLERFTGNQSPNFFLFSSASLTRERVVMEASQKKKKIMLVINLLRKNMFRTKLLLSFYQNRYRKRRIILALLKLSMDSFASILQYNFSSPTKSERVVWRFPRPQFAFEENLYNSAIENHYYWKRNFRMSRETFLKIVQISSSFMSPEQNYVREPVSLEKRVAISLNWLATGNSYNSVGETFGVSKAAVIKFAKLFIKGMFPLRNNFIFVRPFIFVDHGKRNKVIFLRR